MNLQNISYKDLVKVYQNYFSLGYINGDISDKFALISLTCYVTNELRKKGKKVNCYDVLLLVGKDFGDLEKNTFLKSLGAVCEDFMYGCDSFPTFNLKSSEIVKTLKNILDKYVPF